jgi:hypothetical protein
MRVDELLEYFPDHKKSGTGWTARCSGHEDKNPSLTISEGQDGRILLHCHAGCTPDAICSAIGLTLADLFPANGNHQRNGSPPKPKSRPAFDWNKYAACFTDEHAQRLAEWRGISPEFFKWLYSQNVIGISGDKPAFAIRDDNGNIVSAHIRLGPKKWMFEPSGLTVSPLVFGDAKTAQFILAFESQWDLFSVADKLGLHTASGLPDTAFICTRGASNGKLISGHVSPDAKVFAFTQNDKAAQTWLADVTANAGCKVLNVTTPEPHKDCNDWTRAGASADDLQAAIKNARESQCSGIENEDTPNGLPAMVDAASFIAEPLPEPSELIAGILHKGCKLVLGGSSKSFKTWTLLDLALSVSHGSPWLNFQTTPARVLFVNFELQDWTIQKRIGYLERAKNVPIAPGKLFILNLRGHAASYHLLLPQIQEAMKQDFGLCVLDPVYRLYGMADENKAGDIARLLNAVEELCVSTGSAVAFGSHFSKGNQSQKESIDRISGSGVFARDPDSILTFTKHETEDCFVVDATLRAFKPVEPFTVRWNFPLFELASELDPSKLKQAAGRKPENSPDDLLKLLPASGLTNADFLDAAEQDGISKRTFYRLRKALESAKKIMLSKVNDRWMPISPQTKP